MAQFPNRFVVAHFLRRTVSQGFSLAYLRGMLGRSRSVRRVSSPHDVNGVALACLLTALADQDYIRESSTKFARHVNCSSQQFRVWGVRTGPVRPIL